ncbi:dTDP-4-dehydrorhamnose 3,5-epimerase [Bdellovibrio bacteriovorus]|uniref:dTDP-4-dehydrorhamnose 3,5-epimerase n=2 Tax=Bdellovibrio bacteriovorus TaxID=959 RepID=A0A150WLS1_BDEBC|nr:dTDP-4-dehydrorhamnose 3,5-epimerase [Bdellovibrio bacteriovorus]
MLEGVQLIPLKRIANPLGDVFHGLKASENSFAGFGEAYFSSVYEGARKGWKKHTRMTLSLIVISGEVRFVIYDDRQDSASSGEFFEVTLSQKNYARLVVSPGLWLAFQGIGIESNILLNIANIEHDPSEAVNAPIEEISYEW